VSIYACTNPPSTPKPAVAGADLYTNEAIAGLIPKDSKIILNQYLYCLFNAKTIDLSTGNNAIGQSLNSKFLREELKIPLPPPNIQQEIVAALEAFERDKNQLMVDGISMKDFEALVKQRKNEIVKSFL
jgi:restriction endonuclease S subunit